MTARLDLLAHGASAATRATRFPDDEPLEASAVDAIEALSGRLRPYARVLTAPARAARETCAALGFDAEVEMALRDCDYGRWRGLASKDVAQREPDGFAAWLGDPSVAPHGGESLAALIERIGAWLAQSLARESATLFACAVTRRRFPVGASPTRRPLQSTARPVAQDRPKRPSRRRQLAAVRR
jgi:broad specificity phosphatase PhoE